MKVRHQSGYIYRTGRGERTAFHVRFYRTELVDGKETRVQRSGFLCLKDKTHFSESCKAVKDVAAKFMEKINAASGVVVAVSDDIKVVDFFDRDYLPWYKEKCKPDSVKNMLELFDNELRKHFGDITLRAYRRSMARGFFATIEVKRSHDRLTKIKKVAHAIFTRAIDLNKFPEDAETNPWALMKVKDEWGKASGKTKSYTDEEVENILAALFEHTEMQLAFALSAYNGLRHGEMRGLQWDDIDGSWISVRRSVDSFSNIGVPKTEESEGNIPLLPSVAFYLELWRSKWKGIGPWVLSETTEPINLANYTNRFVKPTLKTAAAEALKVGDKHKAETLTWKGWHSGRRSASTFMIDEGNLNLAKQLLRHKHATTTDRSYNMGLPPQRFLEQALAVDRKRLKS